MYSVYDMPSIGMDLDMFIYTKYVFFVSLGNSKHTHMYLWIVHGLCKDERMHAYDVAHGSALICAPASMLA